jgi:hypothetical protein
VFGAGSPDANSVLGKLSNLDKQLRQGNIEQAQSQAQNIVSFIQQKAAQGGLPGTPAQVQLLISSVLCYAGLSPDTFLIYPTDAQQVLKNASGKVGLSLQGNTVSVPTLVTITMLDVSPLITKLDTYPGYVQISSSSPLTKTAVVGVCPSGPIPPDVLARLRLGHQGVTGFEITPAADASFLDCSTTVGQSSMPKWLKALASFVLPKPAYAKTMFAGGVGGLADAFSPFGPVDPELRFAGGAGGLADAFNMKRDTIGAPGLSDSPPTRGAPMPAPTFNRAPGVRTNTVDANGVCTVVDGVAGTALDPSCRPQVTVTTAKGTIITGAIINWAIGLGGGSVASEASTPPCTPFGATATTTTDASGKTRACWTLGAMPGVNTLIATPATGGDAPPGVSFSPTSGTFTATANPIVPIATAAGGTYVFDNGEHPGTGTCTNGLTPAFSYSGGSTPKNAGTYTLTVTCGAGNPLYTTVTATDQIQITEAPTTTTVSCPASAVYTGSPITPPCTPTTTGPGLNSSSATLSFSSNTNVGTATVAANYPAGGNYLASSGSTTFTITPATTTAKVNCPTSVVYTGSAITPCTGGVTGPGGLSLSLALTYSSNIVGTATATVTYVGGGNYQGSTASANFQISYVQSGCFGSPVYSVMPSTKSFQNKGSNLPIKCTLLTASGAGVNNATGGLLIEDLGTSGSATPTQVFQQANVFTASSSGNYSYGLNTGLAGFVSRHFYRISATWSDGSTTTGFFYIK